MKDPVAFISYATQDQTIAGMVCQALEQEHVPCWIAPRNVPVGENAFEAIPRGVAGCTVLVLILSEKATRSEYVQRELQLALQYKKVIIPFRIEDIELDGAVHFMLTGVQWLDAFVPPLERHVAALVRRIVGILDAEKDTTSAIQPIEVSARKIRTANRLAKGIVACIGVAALCFAGYFGFYRISDASIHAAVVQRLQAALSPHGVLIDCAGCGTSEAHVGVRVSNGNVTLDGVVARGDEALVHGVPLNMRGLRTVSYALNDLSTPATNPASPASAQAPARTPAPASVTKTAPVATTSYASGPGSINGASPEVTTPAHALTAEEYRARAAVLTGQQKMREQDYVAAENYFRLALNLDPDNQSARSGLESASKALGEN